MPENAIRGAFRATRGKTKVNDSDPISEEKSFDAEGAETSREDAENWLEVLCALSFLLCGSA
jgi:hypothetical protein